MTIRSAQVEPAAQAVDGPGAAASTDTAGTGPRVAAAVDLGWWMADFYHYLRPRRFEHEPARAVLQETLTDLAHLPPIRPAHLYREGIECAIHELDSARSPLTAPCTAAARLTLEVTDTEHIDVTAVQQAVDDLHQRVLGWLLASDQRLGHGYLLGRLLADSTRDQSAHLDRMQERFAGPRIQQCKWLQELESELPPYSAAAVALSLNHWADAMKSCDGAAGQSVLRRMAFQLPEQGQVWRSLLVGGLDSRELLAAEDYIDIAHEIVAADRRLLSRLLRDALLPIVLALVAVLVPVLAVIALSGSGSTVTRTATALVALGGGAWGLWKTLSGEATKAMAVVNRPLQVELMTTMIARRASSPLTKASGSPLDPASQAPAAVTGSCPTRGS